MYTAFFSLFICLLIEKCVANASNYSYLSVYPPGCNTDAALQCEYEFLQCKLFGGPANDRTTLCDCARSFYGDCLRVAGVSYRIFPVKFYFYLFLVSVKLIMK